MIIQILSHTNRLLALTDTGEVLVYNEMIKEWEPLA